MSGGNQNDIEKITDEVQRGVISPAEANVTMVREARYRIVSGRMPADVRKALNAAVKTGTLRRLKKDGLLPEAYFHPDFDYMARSERNRIAAEGIGAIAKVCASGV